MSVSPEARTVRSVRECFANAVSMWSKKGTVVSMWLTPVPSRLSSSSTVDSLVARRREAVRDPDVADQHAAVVQLLPRRVRIVDVAEQDEVRPRLVRGVVEGLDRRRDAVALLDDLVDGAHHLRRVPEGRARGGLRERA